MIGAAIVELLAVPAVAALVGDRVYPVELPDEPVLPAVAYQVISERPKRGGKRLPGVRSSSLQLSIVAADYDAAYAVAWAIRRRLEGWCGEVGGMVLYDAMEEDSRDVGDAAPHVVAMTWRIHWKEKGE
ncbi:hypothetical protein BUE93_05750 [Chromobacterium amazonense]|uniref:DUF3168 domain-containing protein n=1 Tax=Chromobacterium amazonense TaxID=1382803 RepID=A0A2S9X6Z0_9NEIS|nr:DUF3168 domain-containing protein [Chromobacterium amazonense]PRP71502.1 hypothetical protein BUE93_05750 [Chromobacterium amazonense]